MGARARRARVRGRAATLAARGVRLPAPHEVVMKLLLNPSARSGRARKRLGLDCIESRSPSHFQSLVREAELESCDCLGIAGGDGTVALAASAIEGTNRVPWKIFPVGSGNDFAAHLSSQ